MSFTLFIESTFFVGFTKSSVEFCKENLWMWLGLGLGKCNNSFIYEQGVLQKKFGHLCPWEQISFWNENIWVHSCIKEEFWSLLNKPQSCQGWDLNQQSPDLQVFIHLATGCPQIAVKIPYQQSVPPVAEMATVRWFNTF